MPIFYFHLEMCGTSCPDVEGRDLPDLSCAREHAVRDARDIMAAEVKAGRLCLDCRIDIADGRGTLASSLPFHEAIELSGHALLY